MIRLFALFESRLAALETSVSGLANICAPGVRADGRQRRPLGLRRRRTPARALTRSPIAIEEGTRVYALGLAIRPEQRQLRIGCLRPSRMIPGNRRTRTPPQPRPLVCGAPVCSSHASSVSDHRADERFFTSADARAAVAAPLGSRVLQGLPGRNVGTVSSRCAAFMEHSPAMHDLARLFARRGEATEAERWHLELTRD